MKRKNIVAVAVATILALSMLIACSPKSQSYDKESLAYEPSSYYRESDGFSYNESIAASPAEAPMPSGSNTQQIERKIIRTGSLSIEALDYDKCTSDVNALIEKANGYIEYSKDDNYRRDYRSCSITARIPQENFDSFISGTMEVGNVTSKTINANDVTESYVDVQSRLNVLKEEKASLMKILEGAETVEDLMYVQNRLYDVIEEIESYEARLRSYDSQINYSKVTLSITEVKKETPVEEETWGQEFKRRVTESLENFWEFLKGLGIAIVVVLPWLIIPAIIAIVVVVIVKTAIKRKKVKRSQMIDAAYKKSLKNATDKNNPAETDQEGGQK